MRPTVWTYGLVTLVLASLAAVYAMAVVVGTAPLTLVAVALVGALAVVGAVVSVRASTRVPRPRVGDIAAGAATAALALLLVREMHIPALVAMSIVVVLVGMLVAPWGPLDVRSECAGYAGAFVGLVPPGIVVPSVWVAGAGAMAGLLASVIGPSVLPGVGGRLGLVAFMASSSVYWFGTALGGVHDVVLLPEFHGLAQGAVVPIGAVAATVTWVLIQRRGWDFALASGLTSLLVCGGVYLSSMGDLAPVFAAAWFGGTMVGISAPAQLPGAVWIGFAGMLYGAHLLPFPDPIAGHVGVLGVLAVIAVLVVMGVLRVAGGIAARGARRPRAVPGHPPV